MVRWKVVTRERTSFVAEGKYKLKYRKGAIVHALPNTVGIFTFKTKAQAEELMNLVPGLILKVRPIGRGKTPKAISAWTSAENLNEFYRTGMRNGVDPIPPDGTICYPAVEVLD